MDTEKGQILLVKGRSRYDVTRVFIDDLAEALRALNREVVVIDMVAKENEQQLLNALERPTACLFAFNHVSVDDDPLYEKLLFFNAYIDDPFPWLSHITYLPARMIVTCVDAAYVSLLEQWQVQQRLEGWLCTELSHAGSLLDEPFLDEERPYEIMFSGSYTDPEVLRSQWKSLTQEECDLLEAFIAHAKERRGEPLQQVWEDFASLRHLSELTKIIAYSTIFPLAEIYLRNLLRKEVLCVLGNAGIAVDLYGVGWRDHPLMHKHRLCGFLDYRDLMRQMRKTKIVLNINPPFTQGSHERPLTAMLQKALVITDHNPFFATQFREGEHLCTYNLQQLDALPSIINTLLTCPQRCREIGEQAYQEALRSHTWQVRAEKILAILHRYSQERRA